MKSANEVAKLLAIGAYVCDGAPNVAHVCEACVNALAELECAVWGRPADAPPDNYVRQLYEALEQYVVSCDDGRDSDKIIARLQRELDELTRER